MKNLFVFVLFLYTFNLYALDKVSVQLQWKYQFQFAGFIMAKEKDYYKDVGLDVTLKEYDENYSVSALLNGKVDYFISNSLLLYKNKQLYNTILLATYFQKSPLVFVTQKNIKKVKDLKGKIIIMNENELENSSLSILLAHYNINKSNTTFRPLTYNLDAFIAKKVDAVAIFRSNELFELDQKKVPYNVIDPTEYGYTTSAINLFTSYEKMLSNPEEVDKFLDATKKGWKYALSHISETANIIHTKYNPSKSIDALVYEGKVTKDLMLENIFDIGEINNGYITSIYKQLLKTGKLDKHQKIDTKMLTLYDYKRDVHLYLTHKERMYLEEKKVIKICVDPKWKPYEWIDDKGEYHGMGSDYLNAFTKLIGVKTVLYKTANWSESIEAIKAKKCDVLPMASITQKRKKFLNFTKSYYETPYVIATTIEKNFIEDIAKELDKTYAVVRHSAVIDDLKLHYKNINIVEVDTVLDGLKLVKERKVFGFINNTTAISYLLQKENFINIKIAGVLPFGYKIAVASTKNQPELTSIFNKAIKHLDDGDKELIKNRWLSIMVEKKADYTLVYQILAFFAVLSLAFLYRQIVLKRLNNSLEEKIEIKTQELLKLNSNLEQKVKQRTKELAHQAYYDTLTQLPNRALFNERLEHGIEKAKRRGENLALFFIDLDRFKHINDSLGHQVGDEVLCTVTKRLQSIIRKEDTLSRLGGDEFTIILEHLQEPQNAAKLAQKILHVLEEPLKMNEHQLYVSTSIGISIYPQDDNDANNLLKNADAAMYKAKEEGRNTFQFYSSEMTAIAFAKVMLQGSLRQAIDNGEFTVYYQPQIDAIKEEVIGLEALVRWEHPTEGIISPSHFIATAEETGLIVEIDQFVMTQAMKDFIQWQNQGLKPVKISLNLAAKQLANNRCIEHLQEKLELNNFNPLWLELEVTESDIMRKPEEAIAKLNKIHHLGIKISIDDFGTGYSSLSYLKKLPIDKLKIDQSFVCDIYTNEDDRAIVKAVIALGKSLGLELIAEGVETQEQKIFLVENGCENIQGYYYAKPMNFHDTMEYLEKMSKKCD